MKSILIKTRVGFGRTELSLTRSCTEFCALSSGHGPRGRGFEAGGETLDFHDFFGGSKMGKNMRLQDEHGQISISGALDTSQNDLPTNPGNFCFLVSAQKTQTLRK